MSKISDFDVLKKMSQGNMDISVATDKNVISASFHHKKGSQIVIGVEDKFVNELGDKYMVACYLINKNDYIKARESLGG